MIAKLVLIILFVVFHVTMFHMGHIIEPTNINRFPAASQVTREAKWRLNFLLFVHCKTSLLTPSLLLQHFATGIEWRTG